MTLRSKKFLAVALLLLLSACGGCDTTDPSSEPAVTLANVSYGPSPAQIMDIVLPAGRTGATPVAVFIHGGGWSGGDKSVFGAIDILKFTAAGYATVNMNYRLASTAAGIHDPLLSADVTAVLDLMAVRAGEYKVSATRFGLIGHSAGAHLALLASYKYNASGRIKAVATLAGPTDLNDAAFLAIPGIRATIENYLGVTQAADPARWTAASPVSVATAAASATIILQGQQDVLVPFALAAKLDARLAVLQVPREYHLFPAYNHDLGVAALLRFPDAIWDPTIVWFNRYLK